MLANMDSSIIRSQITDQKTDQMQSNNLRMPGKLQVEHRNEAYWTHSSIREIHAQNSNPLLLHGAGGGPEIENSTPNLTAGKQGDLSGFPQRQQPNF